MFPTCRTLLVACLGGSQLNWFVSGRRTQTLSSMFFFSFFTKFRFITTLRLSLYNTTVLPWASAEDLWFKRFLTLPVDPQHPTASFHAKCIPGDCSVLASGGPLFSRHLDLGCLIRLYAADLRSALPS